MKEFNIVHNEKEENFSWVKLFGNAKSNVREWSSHRLLSILICKYRECF